MAVIKEFFVDPTSNSTLATIAANDGGNVKVFFYSCEDTDRKFQSALLSYSGEPGFSLYFNGTEILDAGQKPSEHHVFNCHAGQWEDPRSLQELKSAKWVEIKAERSNAEFGGFSWDSSTFDSDAISQQRLQGLAQMAAINQGMSVQWTLADNTTRQLNAQDAVLVGIALAAHINAQHAKARELRILIESAQTPEQVLDITWES